MIRLVCNKMHPALIIVVVKKKKKKKKKTSTTRGNTCQFVENIFETLISDGRNPLELKMLMVVSTEISHFRQIQNMYILLLK